jgi:hypothetical protein
MVKFEMEEKDARRGWIYSSRAASMFQDEGVADGVKRENVRWYVRAYFTDRVVRFAKASATSGARAFGLLSGGAELVERRYAIIACSSAKISRSLFAMYVASVDDVEELVGIWFGV